MATPNMPASEWPELEPEEIREVGQLVQDVQYLKDHSDDGPLPGTSD
jgi:hypothetical protein